MPQNAAEFNQKAAVPEVAKSSIEVVDEGNATGNGPSIL